MRNSGFIMFKILCQSVVKRNRFMLSHLQSCMWMWIGADSSNEYSLMNCIFSRGMQSGQLKTYIKHHNSYYSGKKKQLVLDYASRAC